jgi:predicted GIY-YIG superfamily endonuclease
MPIRKFRRHKYILEGKGFPSIRQVAKYYSIDQSTVCRRMKLGLTLEEALKPTIIDDNCKGTIYIIDNCVNNKLYVGLTTQSISVRFARHIIDARRGSNNKFHKALRRIGADKFKIRKIARSSSKSKLVRLEVKYINKFNSIEKGYNTDPGGKSLNEFFGKPVLFKGTLFKSITKLSEHLGIARSVIHYRMKRNLPLDAIPNKGGVNAVKVKYLGITYKTLDSLAKHLNISPCTVKRRLDNGYCLNGLPRMTGKKGYHKGEYA